MGSHLIVRLVWLVLAVTIIQGIHATEYEVGNLAKGEGGRRFRDEIGDGVAISIMEEAIDFVRQKVLQQSSSTERKELQRIDLIIDAQVIEDSTHYKIDDKTYSIHLKAASIKSCPKGHLKEHITPLIYFEIACILQWTTENKENIMRSIAFFATLKANYETSNMVHFGQGDKWDQSAEVTAQFLVYCNNKKPEFVAFLNKKMRTSSFSENYFQEFFNESIDDLWKDYKHKYGGNA